MRVAKAEQPDQVHKGEMDQLWPAHPENLTAYSDWLGKADQILATKATYAITPCHNCFDQINDLSEEYDLGIKALALKEILVESMIIPDHMRLEDA